MERNVETLLGIRLSEMTGSEFCSLLHYALNTEQVNEKQNATDMQDEFPDEICEGLSRLRYYIGHISLSRLMDIAHEGVLDEAVLYTTKNGRIKTYDVKKARNLINGYLLKKHKK